MRNNFYESFIVAKGVTIKTLEGILNVISVDAHSGTALCEVLEFEEAPEDYFDDLQLVSRGNHLYTAADIAHKMHDCNGRLYKVFLADDNNVAYSEAD